MGRPKKPGQLCRDPRWFAIRIEQSFKLKLIFPSSQCRHRAAFHDFFHATPRAGWIPMFSWWFITLTQRRVMDEFSTCWLLIASTQRRVANEFHNRWSCQKIAASVHLFFRSNLPHWMKIDDTQRSETPKLMSYLRLTSDVRLQWSYVKEFEFMSYQSNEIWMNMKSLTEFE